MFSLNVIPYLDRTIMSNQLVLHRVVPQATFCEVFQQVRIHNLWARWDTHSNLFFQQYTTMKMSNCIRADLKFSWEHPACVDVTGVGLNGLVVTQDLGSGGCGHGSQQQTVPHTMPDNTEEQRRSWIRVEPSMLHASYMTWETEITKPFMETYLAIFSFNAFQSHNSVGVFPHMSYCRIWNTK